jgi:hypothetical protein
MNDWTGKGQDELLRLRGHPGAWGYRKDREAGVEPTALACLALWSCRSGSLSDARPGAIQRGADWLLSIQNADGSLGLAPSLPSPCWATSHAILTWNALNVHTKARRRAAAWLLEQKGNPVTVEAAYRGSVVGHDPTLIGWPWTEGTHSWIEPTAMAILALQREGLGNHARVAEGTRVVLDRALSEGGWNYGNTSVFGRQLRPHPEPTGLALLALAVHLDKFRSRSVDLAINYLLQTLPEVRAPISLGWGVLGLRAWKAAPTAAADWLSESYALHTGRRDAAIGLSLLLLAQGDDPFVAKEPRL